MPDGSGSGAFISGLIGGFGNAFAEKRRRHHEEEIQADLNRLNIIGHLIGQPDFPQEAKQQAMADMLKMTKGHKEAKAGLQQFTQLINGGRPVEGVGLKQTSEPGQKVEPAQERLRSVENQPGEQITAKGTPLQSRMQPGQLDKKPFWLSQQEMTQKETEAEKQHFEQIEKPKLLMQHAMKMEEEKQKEIFGVQKAQQNFVDKYKLMTGAKELDANKKQRERADLLKAVHPDRPYSELLELAGQQLITEAGQDRAMKEMKAADDHMAKVQKRQNDREKLNQGWDRIKQNAVALKIKGTQLNIKPYLDEMDAIAKREEAIWEAYIKDPGAMPYEQVKELIHQRDAAYEDQHRKATEALKAAGVDVDHLDSTVTPPAAPPSKKQAAAAGAGKQTPMSATTRIINGKTYKLHDTVTVNGKAMKIGAFTKDGFIPED